MSRAQTLRVLLDLSRGIFRGRPGRSYWQTPELSLACPHHVPLELDGEVVHTDQVEFEILGERIGVCR